MKHCGFKTDFIRPDHTYSVLSRYNGIGSLKLSISTAHNQRTNNLYTNGGHRTNGRQHGDTDSSYAEMTANGLPNIKNDNSILANKLKHSDKQMHDLKTNAKFNLGRKLPKNRQTLDTIYANEPNTANKRDANKKSIPKITSTNSIYSTSTISNSSLQEYDDNELDTTELAKYMRQINKEIHHDTK